MSYVFPSLMLLICLGCSCDNKAETNVKLTSEAIKKYVLKGNPKTNLLIKDDGSFDYISIDRKNHPNDLFFRSSGVWEINGDTIYLTSLGDSLDRDTASVIKLPADDSSNSVIRFYDVFNDSIGFMYVTYPDGKDYKLGSDMGDRIFDWFENLKTIKHLEFHFVNYNSWKYYSDGKNYNLNVYLKPKFDPNIFKNEKYVLSGDTLVNISNPTKYLFVREDNPK